MKYYRQCSFKQSNKRTVAWIEERGAKVGYKVSFKDEDDGGLWEVTSVSDSRITEEAAKRTERLYKNAFPSLKNN